MIRRILGLIDIFAGIMLIVMPHFSFLMILGFFCMGKGIWSIFSSFAMGYFFEWMGTLDLITGICLYLLSSGTSFGLFVIVGITIIMKGLYSMA